MNKNINKNSNNIKGNTIMVIYKITNTLNNKIYIGCTINRPSARWSKHKSCSRRGSKLPIHNAIRKYGEQNFTFTVIHNAVSFEELMELEKYYISLYDSNNKGYNICSGGKGTFGHTHTEEWKIKNSELHAGNQYNKGKKHSDEWRKNHTEYMKYKNPFKGKKHTEETKKKISESKKGTIVSEKTKEKIRLANTGKKHTEETKKKISESKKGKRRPSHVSQKLKTMHNIPILQFTKTGRLIAEYESTNEAYRKTGISVGTIRRGLKCENGYTTFKGYVWAYKSQFTDEELIRIYQEAFIK